MKVITSFITGCIAVVTIIVIWNNSINPERFIWSLICVGCLIMFSSLLTAEVVGHCPNENDNTPPP